MNEHQPLKQIIPCAREAAELMKALGHEGRFIILCRLCRGESSVTELEELLSARQAAVSQQLTRLRLEGLVNTRREGKAVYYSLADPRVKEVIALFFDLYCTP